MDLLINNNAVAVETLDIGHKSQSVRGLGLKREG